MFSHGEAKAADRLAAYVCPDALQVAKVRAPRRGKKVLRIDVEGCCRCGGSHDAITLHGWRTARDDADLDRLVSAAWSPADGPAPAAEPVEKVPTPRRAKPSPKSDAARAAILVRLAGGDAVASADLQAASGVSQRTFHRVVRAMPEVEKVGASHAARYRATVARNASWARAERERGRERQSKSSA